MKFEHSSFNTKMAVLGLIHTNYRTTDLLAESGLIPVRVPRKIERIAMQWCQDKFDDNWIWSSPIFTEYTDLYFRTSEDALLFKLSVSIT